MSVPLARLLTIRRVLEESSRMELERCVALAARIERAQEREKLTMRQSLEEVLTTVVDESNLLWEQTDRRTMGWLNAENAAARWGQLRTVAEATANQVVEARAAFLERRTERRQVESVLTSQQELRRIEQERRTQRELDDWFSLKQVKRRRNLAPDDPQS